MWTGTDAKAYVAWLSRKTGSSYRLLSEAEREYVARAGTITPFWWGSTISTSQANYDGNRTYGGGAKGENRQKTVPVEFFEPNPWGLYQVHGNVSEWVEDCHRVRYDVPTDGSAGKPATALAGAFAAAPGIPVREPPLGAPQLAHHRLPNSTRSGSGSPERLIRRETCRRFNKMAKALACD